MTKDLHREARAWLDDTGSLDEIGTGIVRDLLAENQRLTDEMADWLDIANCGQKRVSRQHQLRQMSDALTAAIRERDEARAALDAALSERDDLRVWADWLAAKAKWLNNNRLSRANKMVKRLRRRCAETQAAVDRALELAERWKRIDTLLQENGPVSVTVRDARDDLMRALTGADVSTGQTGAGQ